MLKVYLVENGWCGFLIYAGQAGKDIQCTFQHSVEKSVENVPVNFSTVHSGSKKSGNIFPDPAILDRMFKDLYKCRKQNVTPCSCHEYFL